MKHVVPIKKMTLHVDGTKAKYKDLCTATGCCNITLLKAGLDSK
jgi:hypothetical protein